MIQFQGMKKYTALLSLAIFALCTLFFGQLLSAEESSKRPAKPNVLFIMSDDLNTALSGFGHPQCKTPHLDALADVGVKFERMYCQQPVCGPSRASIMSGLYPYKNGVTRNKIYLREHSPDVTTMSELFKNAGYYVARVGKIYHMGVPGDIAAGTSGTDGQHA